LESGGLILSPQKKEERQTEGERVGKEASLSLWFSLSMKGEKTKRAWDSLSTGADFYGNYGEKVRLYFFIESKLRMIWKRAILKKFIFILPL